MKFTLNFPFEGELNCLGLTKLKVTALEYHPTNPRWIYVQYHHNGHKEFNHIKHLTIPFSAYKFQRPKHRLTKVFK